MVEQLRENDFRATALVPTEVVAEASTRDEAVVKIRTMLSERLARAEVIQVSVPVGGETNPWLAIAGTWRDHPDIDEFEANIQAYRNQVNTDPNRL